MHINGLTWLSSIGLHFFWPAKQGGCIQPASRVPHPAPGFPQTVFGGCLGREIAGPIQTHGTEHANNHGINLSPGPVFISGCEVSCNNHLCSFWCIPPPMNCSKHDAALPLGPRMLTAGKDALRVHLHYGASMCPHSGYKELGYLVGGQTYCMLLKLTPS